MQKLKVLMIGPARDVKGGMTTVVDNYYKYGLDKEINLKYIETINDKGKLSKFIMEKIGKIKFYKNINKYDIVHIHMASRRSSFRKGKFARIAKKKGKKVIVHIHGAEYKKFYNECNNNQKKYVRKTLNIADKIIVLSEEWKEYFDNLVDNKTKVVVIYNSIVIPEDFEKNVNTQKLLFLGRIGHRKGIYDLIDVIEKLILIYPNLKLYIGGDGEINKLCKVIDEKQLNDNVKYIGWVDESKKEKYLKESSFYILPSYNEGMPMSVLEGMAYKNITISTNVGGIPRVIKNNENGIIIEPGDKEKLFSELNSLLMDEEKRELLSFNARKRIEDKFNISSIIKKLMEMYND